MLFKYCYGESLHVYLKLVFMINVWSLMPPEKVIYIVRKCLVWSMRVKFYGNILEASFECVDIEPTIESRDGRYLGSKPRSSGICCWSNLIRCTSAGRATSVRLSHGGAVVAVQANRSPAIVSNRWNQQKFTEMAFDWGFGCYPQESEAVNSVYVFTAGRRHDDHVCFMTLPPIEL